MSADDSHTKPNKLDMFRGQTSNITIQVFNLRTHTYEVPRFIYAESLLEKPSHIDEFKHTIKVKIDGRKYDAAPKIIYFMHCAVLEPIVLPKVSGKIDPNEPDQLQAELAVISWCNMMIKKSKVYENYVDDVRTSIKNMVALVRAIVADNDECVGGIDARLKLLSQTGLPLKVPNYLSKWILLPAADDNRDNMLKRSKSVETCIFSSTNIGLCIGACDLYSFGQKAFFEKRKLTGADIVAANATMQADLFDLQLRLLCYEHPKYMKIEHFGPECSAAVASLLGPKEIALHNRAQPKMNICHVFEHGLAAALTADYL